MFLVLDTFLSITEDKLITEIHGPFPTPQVARDTMAAIGRPFVVSKFKRLLVSIVGDEIKQFELQ